MLEEAWGAAEQDLQRVVDGDPSNTEALQSLAYTYAQLGNAEASARYYREYLNFNRITSYNVCYTKLLRPMKAWPSTRVPGTATKRWPGSACRESPVSPEKAAGSSPIACGRRSRSRSRRSTRSLERLCSDKGRPGPTA